MTESINEQEEDLVEIPLSSFQLAINVYIKNGKFDELIERLKNKDEKNITISSSIFNEAKEFLNELKGSNSIMANDLSDADKIIQCAGCCNYCGNKNK